ncbi:MAG: replication initiator protein [Arizlama microvirus]|nr:MAG: replication initiator protein [Arizlama microvirus]
MNVKTANGKPTISFKNPYAKPSASRVGIQVPCGQCIGCRLERSRQWAMRCVHEAYGHDDNAFITLTYAPEHVPPDGSLIKSHFQKFMKRLRKAISPKLVRFFHCGEYGELHQRPHYHACLFGYDFPDKILYTIRDECRLYRSPMLEKLWPNGFATVGDVTFESAAYVARYITKKITGDLAEKHYQGRQPEYTTMSRRPGIGKLWYENFKGDVFPCDNVVIRGKVMKPPRYYDKQLELSDAQLFAKIKIDRKAKALQNAADNTTARLAVKETCKIAQFQQLKRGLENET